ncbi:hypothetical protein [Pseudomonas matsuisoli]|uniref:Uncharacterized protein n=1 Tax=Pseudomonas matsuisoli TaxID=1515666 RepID=A0A917Q588_9PSED|nr:hypothetical protein [Pseudomonas matsuisoli]GGK10513.1 hypothetical protein GCM10009304_40630 [Pseudomonas matsuisoli]
MHDLKRYSISYRLNGEPDALIMEGFDAPTLDQVRLQLLIKHVPEPQVVEDAPWEEHLQSSLESRSAELGLSDIEVERID